MRVASMLPVIGVSLALSTLAAADAARARAWLGVSVQDVTAELREAMDLTARSGALVSEVIPDSPADDAGILVRDVIIRFDETTVEDADDLVSGLRSQDPGDGVEIVLLRAGEERKVRVELAEPEGGEIRREYRFGPGSGDAPRPPVPPNPPMPGFAGGPQIGVVVHPLDQNLAGYFHTEPGEGVLVLRVEPESPASKAGLIAGDVIRRFNGEPVSDSADLRRQVQRLEPGDDWKASVLREGKETEVEGRMERGWRSPAEMGDFQMPIPDLGAGGPVSERRQMRRLERELDELRAKLRELEQEVDRLRQR
jgi:serine protease Do